VVVMMIQFQLQVFLQEEGCINFDLHQDNENKNLFICYENWESKEDWIRHFEKAKALDDKTQFNEHALDDYTFNEMTMIE
jgi:quinol monooxygenase YgiN